MVIFLRQGPLPGLPSAISCVLHGAPQLHQSEQRLFNSCPITESDAIRRLPKQTWQPAGTAHCQEIAVNLTCRRSTINMLSLTIREVSGLFCRNFKATLAGCLVCFEATSVVLFQVMNSYNSLRHLVSLLPG